MPKNSVSEYDTTASNNTDVGGVSTAEGMTPGLLNNGIRELMAQIKKAVANQGSDIASASTTDIGAATGQYVKVTGTTTITALGTVAAGTMRWVEFTGALTLTHNGTSLILPTSANITTAAGDTACFVSLGSGNWKCLHYVRLDGTALSYGSSLAITSSSAGTLATLTSTDAGALQGPDLVLHRDSASPADNDLIGTIIFRGEDDGSAATDYASIQAQITDVTDGTEDCSLYFTTLAAGAATQLAIENGGMRALGFGYANKGQGTLNMAGVYIGGHGTVAQRVTVTSVTNQTLGTILPYDDSIPQSGEGDEIFTVAITPINASSVLYIDAIVNMGGPSGTAGCIALFVDATAGALAAAATTFANSTDMSTITLRYSVSAASTSARTYKLRGGASGAGDAFLNGHNSSRIFGGVAVSSLTVTEVLPQ
jgi:hypothetical protein